MSSCMMRTYLFLALILTSSCLAFAVEKATSLGSFKRDFSCPDNAAQEVLMKIGYYSDANCQNILTTISYSTCPNFPSGTCGCDPANIGHGPSVFGKVTEAKSNKVQLALTRNQACPPGGASAIIATFVAGSSTCIQLQGLTGDEGAAIYPSGGSGVSMLESEPPTASVLTDQLIKRDTHCSGFTKESEQNAYSKTVQVSDIVNCQNSAAPCVITEAKQHTKSVTSSYSFTVGGAVEGFSASATFGMDYTDSVSTTSQTSYSVPVNQEGYLSAYSQATLFKGKFTGCDGGDRDGQALALKPNTLTYAVVLTNG